MTFRTRQAPKPTRRRARRSDTRRTIYITLMFTLAMVCALSLLGGVFVASYYQDHGAPIAAVAGEPISKDAVKDRIALNKAHFDRQLADYLTLRNQGKMTSDDYSALENSVLSAETSINSNTLTQLINEAEIRQYATKNNITVSDQQVQAQIKTDSTVPAMRHVKIISVPVEAKFPNNSPTQADIDAALTKAQGYLKEVQGGKAWDDVQTEADSIGASSGTGGGDLGLLPHDSASLDPALADAIFALAKTGDATAIIKGSDGGPYQFATVTGIVPEWVDSDFESAIDATVSSGAYGAYARQAAIKTAVQAFVEAKYVTGATDQRFVNEIFVSTGLGKAGDGDEVKLKMLVYSPVHPAVSGVTASSIAATDPAWAKAKARADAAVAELRADPSKFATLAADTTNNDDINFSGQGGDVPWISGDIFNAQTLDGNTGLDMTAVAAAVFAPGLKAGTLLDALQEPSSGYVVVLFQGRRAAPDQRIANAVWQVNNGVDFATEAKIESEAADGGTGGQLGWVSPYMLTLAQQNAVYNTPVGRVSDIVSANGYYVYQVVKEENRIPDAAQQVKLKKIVFSSWLNELQASALVWQDTAAVSALASATPPAQ